MHIKAPVLLQLVADSLPPMLLKLGTARKGLTPHDSPGTLIFHNGSSECAQRNGIIARFGCLRTR